ncbi:MAG TPA: hypothetical protein VMJ35_10695 [Dongiaceae bacterium]|nr:hypothetical protein [Dongiaceae bacterium]
MVRPAIEKNAQFVSERARSAGVIGQGDFLYNVGRFNDACAAYEIALMRQPNTPAIQAKLGVSMVRAGFARAGIARLTAWRATTPQVPELYEGLVLSYIFLDRLGEAAEIAEQKIRFVAGLFPGDYLRAASLWAELQETGRARGILQQGLRAYPSDADLQHAWQLAQLLPSPQILENSELQALRR